MKVKEQTKNWKFSLSDIEDFKSVCEEVGVDIPVSEDVSVLSNPVSVGKLKVPNSLAVHPMEGADGDCEGRPGPLTLRRYKRFAAGGAGLIWAEAIAVTPEGRANPRQLWLNEKSKQSFADMVSEMRKAARESMGPDHDPVIVAQLTHSGRYSKPEGFAQPLVPELDPYRDALIPEPEPTTDRPSKVDESCVISDEYLDNLQQKYVKAARLAYEVGFDAIDIKSCHGYLINEILASRNRDGKYGGSFENRTRFVLEVIDKIKAELGDKIEIGLRLNFYDAIPYPYGWGVDEQDYKKADLTEPKKLVALLMEKGVRLINFTIGNPYYNPHVGRPFNMPIKGAYEDPEHPLKGIERLINIASEVQNEFPKMTFIGTGYSWLRQLMGNVAAGAIQSVKSKIVGAGRMAFAYPDFAKDLLRKGQMDKDKVCVGCSACTQLMRDGQTAGCVVRDNKIYGPIFKHGRMSDRANLARLASNCLQCQEPTCQQACPAGINIPVFIQDFLEGNDEKAYKTIRESNVLPEVCAWLCPVQQQCQGNCIQSFIGDRALPIADIQRYLSEQANKKGWSKLNIPTGGTGKKIAVIGGGPAGVAAAAVLLEQGHEVTVYDKNKDMGGMIASVIPADRQSRALQNEIKAIFSDVPANRLKFTFGSELNDKFNLDDIMSEGFDAAFIGMGLPAAMRTSEDELEDLYGAIEFLEKAKNGELDLDGKRVGVIGGGNTAMDAAVMAKQLGASDVYVIYRRSFQQMPAWSAERDRAVESGVHFMILTQPLEYNAEGSKIKSVKLCPTILAEADQSGRRRPVPQKESSFDMQLDIVVEAIGQKSAEKLNEILPGVEIEHNLVKTKENSFESTRQMVFAGGDIVHGASTVVEAVADGMRAANEINESLKG